MEAPYLPQSVFKEDFERVYEPAEDTFLLLDALENDLEALKANAFVCLECGSGSGTVITALAKALSDKVSAPSRLMIATDINVNACRTTKKCARYHDQNHIQVVRTNLADSLVDRLENSVDLLVFNPPYVPTTQDEIQTGSDKPIYLSWAGGQRGRTLTDQYLDNCVPKLLSKPNGVAYLVALDKNDIGQLQGALVDSGLRGSIAIHRRAGIEHLYVIKYVWMQ